MRKRKSQWKSKRERERDEGRKECEKENNRLGKENESRHQ